MKSLHKPGGPPRSSQLGAATLLMVLGLVLLATLASGLSSRTVLMDLLTTQSFGQSLHARHAAQGALATAEAQIQQIFESTTKPQPWPLSTPNVLCPAPWKSPRWQCAALPLAHQSTLGDWSLQAVLLRDLLNAPHVWQLQAQARHASGRGQAAANSSVFVPVLPPMPRDTPVTALLLNGCFSETPGSRWQLCPTSTSAQACTDGNSATALFSHFIPDSNNDGDISVAERSACLAVSRGSLPAGGTLIGPQRAVQRSPCNGATWRSVFGETTAAQLQAWSQAQVDNGLHELSQPARSIYWVDSTADWTQSLGRPEAPVLLVFSRQACAQRCPRMAAGVQIHGTVFVDTGCEDERLRGWQGGTIDGLLAIEGGLPEVTGSSMVRARSYARLAFDLHWPAGIDSRQVQRVSGSHRTGAP